MLVKPGDIFDRDREWAALARFATDDSPGASLAVVSGRRRQGKTFLLDALTSEARGFYFAATEATSDESLRLLGEALAQHLGLPASLRLDTWEAAIDALLGLGRDRPVPVVLDEFPYLVRSSPELPSVVQKALGPRRAARTASRARLVLCGSAMTFMGKLLSGSAPLRGRASLELVVPTLDFRQAARFWEIDDPRLAALLHAVVGGTPAYKTEYARGDRPTSIDDFDDWVVRTVLDATSPLFREARYLLAEEPGLREPSLYHSVLAAVAEGNTTRGGIANYVGRSSSDLAHPLNVLEDAGLLVRESDAFRPARPRFRIAEPLMAFYHAVMRPSWSLLGRPGRARDVWRSSRARFSTQVVGPHFERMCREWTATAAAPDTMGALPHLVTWGLVPDPGGRTHHEVDVVAFGDEMGRKVLALGEAKWGHAMTARDLDRLVHVRELVAARPGLDTTDARLLLFSGAGFHADLHSAARDGDVVLVDLDRLYAGGTDHV
ncbi:MAG: ATP-binding protein [Actinomycetales bacterium]